MEIKTINQILNLVKTTELNISDFVKQFKVSKEEILELLINEGYLGFKNKPNSRFSSVKKLKAASEYFIEKGCENVTYAEVAKLYGIKKMNFKYYMEEHFPDIPIIAKYYDDTVFDSIDTEEKAYWLGFIYADGNINSDPLKEIPHYTFELGLSKKDEDHLRKFANFIKYKKSIKNKVVKYKNKEYQAVRIQIHSKHLWNTLNNYGCTPKKSLTLKFPDRSIFKDESLIRHFIRGYFDGDGSLGIYENKVDKYTYHNKFQCSLLGTYEFLLKASSYIGIEKEPKSKGSEKYPDKAFVITYVYLQALEVCNYMYDDSTIYLDRKYLKYLEYCRLRAESCRELETKIGEGCDANPEVTIETKESVAP